MADYVKYFGFSEDPFTGKPDPSFYFPSESHNEALTSLQYGIREKKGFMLLLGERGMGKTTLVQHLTEKIGEKVIIVFIPDSGIPYKELLSAVLQQLGIPSQQRSKGSMLHELYNYLIGRLEADETVALVLDEAHSIDESLVEEVRLLTNLETSNSKLLQLILCGEPKLRNKLQSDRIRQIGQRIVITSRIKPMTRTESLRYIDHRLELVGSTQSSLFTERAAATICRLAGGVPLAIDVMCSNSLSLACSLGRDQVTAPMVLKISREKKILDYRAPEQRANRMHLLPSRKKQAFIAGCIVLALLFFFGRDYARSFLEHFSPPEQSFSAVSKEDVKWEANLKMNLYEVEDRDTAKELSRESVPVAEIPPESPSDSEIDTEIGIGSVEPTIEFPEIDHDSLSPPAMTGTDESDRKPKIKATIEAQGGDSLSSLALKHYGMYNITIIDCVLDMNPSITNPDLIMLHQKITLPEITEQLIIRQGDGTAFMVHLATFTNSALADQYRRNTPLEGISVEIEARRVSPVITWYRVMAGPYAEWHEAVQALDEMRSQGLLVAFYGASKR